MVIPAVPESTDVSVLIDKRDLSHDDPPLLNLMVPANARSFMVVRRMLLSTGARYDKRLNIVSTGAFVVLVTGTVSLCVTVAVDPQHEWSEHMVQAVIGLNALTVLLATLVAYGAKTNSHASLHREQVIAASTTVLDCMMEAKSKRDNVLHEYLADSISVLRSIMDEIENDDKVHPTTVFGARASLSMVRSTIVVALSCISLVLRLGVFAADSD
jgi:hypothetical protein